VPASPARPAAARRRAPTPTGGAAKTARKRAAPAVAPAAQARPPKHRPRLVRDGFTMPESDFALIAALKARALRAGRETKKSEVLRAGLHVLHALGDAALLDTLGRLLPLKTGRPKKGH
jgi:hypothetical protein